LNFTVQMSYYSQLLFMNFVQVFRFVLWYCVLYLYWFTEMYLDIICE